MPCFVVPYEDTAEHTMTTAPVRHTAPKPLTSHRATPDASVYALKSTEDTLLALSQPIDPRHYKSIQRGKGDKAVSLSFIPWGVICKCLHSRAAQWNFEIQEVKELAGSVVVVGRLTIPCTDGLLHFSGTASEPIDSPSQAPPVESAASSCLRRCAALAGLGLDLYLN